MSQELAYGKRLATSWRGALQTGMLVKTSIALGLTVLLLIVGGCSREIGTKYEPPLADRLMPGSSTFADAVRLLGKPFKTKGTLRGITWAEWWYLKDHRQRTESQNLVALFAANGTLLSIVRRHDNQPQLAPSND